MATVYRCDRCLSEFEKAGEISNINIEHEPPNGNYQDRVRIVADLCTECLKELKNFVKPIPKESHG